jgi:hypothetical protein
MSAPVGDLDLYLWVYSNEKPIPGSVQVSGTRYSDPQVKYLPTCRYLQVLTTDPGLAKYSQLYGYLQLMGI